ncbi:DUF3253 domain-containing protein [Euzebya rosea]|uniref:DUF3253 domain-containing protein n=1 Tax=Euzebya rosea TaxID=2052804 RepID=UPI000D3E89E5|nr:DUF3253 domain-containing protein [Euzebya rosea]
MTAETTADGHHIVVDGRRWRATDPAIPEAFRQELVNELMAARRAVRDADGEEEERAARRRVQDAKVALGERGHPWWEAPTHASLADRSASTAVALLRGRAPKSSICPSDVARVVGGEEWRDHLPAVRDHLWTMVDDDVLRATQGDDELASRDGVKGPIRLRRGPRF